MRIRVRLGLLLALSTFAGCVSVTVQPPPPAPAVAPSPPGPLGELNLLFREAYRARREALEKEASPVIVVAGDGLTLTLRGTVETAVVIPPLYHALKAVAHVPFTLNLLLEPSAGARLSEAELGALRDLEGRLKPARGALATHGLSAAASARQERILDASERLLATALADGAVSAAALASFRRAMVPEMLANGAEAASEQVLGTHRQMMLWKTGMSCEEWGRLLVVNRARHQSRYRSAATQYFAWLTGERGPGWAYPGESSRVIYGESLGKTEDALDLLGSVLLDAQAGAAFFDNPWRLSEDFLSDGAASAVARLPAVDRECGDG